MDRYVPCAYCSVAIPVGSVAEGTVQCRLCNKPTFVSGANLQAGEPSSSSSTSIRPPSPEAPIVAEPAGRNIQSLYRRFIQEETERIRAARPESTQQEALAEASKKWATDGYVWVQQQGRQQ